MRFSDRPGNKTGPLRANDRQGNEDPFEEGRSKEMEVEADLQGIRTMMELGYDWKSYINYLEKLDHLMGDASAEISNPSDFLRKD